MYELPDAIIIIPVRIDQPQRLVNLERTVSFLRHHLSTKIYVIEQDTECRIPESLRNEFVRDGDTFYKTRLFNHVVATNPESVLFFLDVDVLVDPKAYHSAYVNLKENSADVCLLYTRKNPDFLYVDVEPGVLAEIPVGDWMPTLSTLSGITAPCEGGIVAIRRDAFQYIGGFNERFIGYGLEDSEIILRAKRFGLRYKELPFSIYHQAHEKIYMSNSIKREHISDHIMNFTKSHSLSEIQADLRPKTPRYVTMTPSGGRLGNLLFEVAALFQYAKMTGRYPYIKIPSEYQEFLRPLQPRMSSPLAHLPVKRVESLDASSAVFYTEFPLSYDSTPVVNLVGGYVQSPQMFQDVRWMLQDLLGSKSPGYPPTRVLVHVRRGDYTKYKHIYEQLGTHYYTRAMAYVKGKYPSCTFVVCSDSIDIVKNEPYFQRDDVEFFNDGGMTAPSVLQELSRYSTFILANSTFGLWGALLSSSANTVVAPLHWSRADTTSCLGFWTTLYEPSWVRISNRPLTIRSDNPDFSLFAPSSDDEYADIALFTTQVPDTRLPNARLHLLLTNHPSTYLEKIRPSAVDYMLSTEFDYMPQPDPSWKEHPTVYVGSPGTLQHFHFVQSVAETLLNKPKLSILLLGPSDTRPGIILQSLNSLYLQTERSWEILFPSPHPPSSGIGNHLFNYLAIPNLLVTLPGSPNVFHTSLQTRSSIIAYASIKSLSAKTRLKSELDMYSNNSIVATRFIDEYSQSSLLPAAVGFRLATLPDISRFCTTFLASRSLLDKSCWFSPDTQIQFVYSPKVRYLPDLFQSKNHILADNPPTSLPSIPNGPLIRSYSNIVNGLNRPDETDTQTLRTSRSKWSNNIGQQKKKFGLNYLL
jgi:hypothetical protein